MLDLHLAGQAQLLRQAAVEKQEQQLELRFGRAQLAAVKLRELTRESRGLLALLAGTRRARLLRMLIGLLPKQMRPPGPLAELQPWQAAVGIVRRQPFRLAEQASFRKERTAFSQALPVLARRLFCREARRKAIF